MSRNSDNDTTTTTTTTTTNDNNHDTTTTTTTNNNDNTNHNSTNSKPPADFFTSHLPFHFADGLVALQRTSSSHKLLAVSKHSSFLVAVQIVPSTIPCTDPNVLIALVQSSACSVFEFMLSYSLMLLHASCSADLSHASNQI